MVLEDAESLVTDPGNGNTLGEQRDPIQGDGFTGLHCGCQTSRLSWLHTDDLDLGHELLDEDGDPCGKTTTTDRYEDPVDVRCVLDELQADGSLTSDDHRVVEGGDVGQSLVLGQFEGVSLGFVEGIPGQDHLAAELAHGVNLDRRSGSRHDDLGLDREPGTREGDALGVVAGRRRHHPGATLPLGEVAHPVVGAADLEGVDCLTVLPLHQHGVVEAFGDVGHRFERGLLGHLVDRCSQDGSQIFLVTPDGHWRSPQSATGRTWDRSRTPPRSAEEASIP